jgi:hypothetical protein
MLEQTWSDEQKRAFLREIMWLYRRRGTPAGIAKLVELHTGVKSPRVIEHYPAWRERVAGKDEAAGAGVAFADHQARLQAWLNAPGIESHEPFMKLAEPRHHFSIWLPGYALADQERHDALHHLLAGYIPAHTHYTLRRLPERGFRLSYARKDGSQTPGVIVGVDAVLGSPPDWRVSPGVAPERRLGIGTLLPAAAGPVGIFQLGSGPLRRPPRRHSNCSSCHDREEG